MTYKERRETHDRWCEKGVASSSLTPGTKEHKMYEDGKQCGGCAFYLTVDSDLGMDWGCCSHAKSKFDGHVVFEHFTCEAYTARPEIGEECNECFGSGSNPCPHCKGTGLKGGKA